MPKKAAKTIEYTAKGGETLCHVAVFYKFPDCTKIRAANPGLKDRKILNKGDKIKIPPKVKGKDGGPDKSKNKFKKPNVPLPHVWFIKENGAGYPTPVPSRSDEGKFPAHYPKGDPKLKQLNITNYHIDKAGDGTAAFAGAADHKKDDPSSEDPDHFKVQVYDNKAGKGVDTVEVKLYAMRPRYRKYTKDGKTYIQWTKKYKYPTDNKRKLTVTCKRVGETHYFRSPYLRLVTTESDRAQRPQQALLVSDYYDDGPDRIAKRYTEILNHKVRAIYTVKLCTKKKCKLIQDVYLKNKKEVRIAVHIMKGSVRKKEDLREQVYKWMRRTLAQAHIRPHLKQLRFVKIPKNMLTVADGDGKHADGTAADGRIAMVYIWIDGNLISYAPNANDSPAKTAQGIKKALEKKNYKVRGPFDVKTSGLTPVAGSVSLPQDLLIFDNHNKQVEIDSARSTDKKQNLKPTNDTDVDNFKVGWPFQVRDGRSMHHNYCTKHFDIFVCGTTLRKAYGDLGGLFGFSPYGSFDGYNEDIGPITFLNAAAGDPAQKPFNPTHEAMHPLMHVTHTVAPAGAKEVMNASTSVADGVDATKHIADAPIAIQYTVVGKGQNILLDGNEQTLNDGVTKFTDTPVRRLQRVGLHYKMIGNPTRRRTIA